jgi:ABC-2 type transport system ATP-binding protein
MKAGNDVIITEGLSKEYASFVAVDGLNISIKEGSCVGFLGPNGSGKSTTIKLLTGLSRATSGRAYIFGYEVGKETRRALLNVGSVVETPVFPPFLSPVEVLSYFGKLRGMSEQSISERSKMVLETVRLGEWASRKIGSFSKGMTQRVALASALLHDPDLLILDEPTSGLDPRGRVEVREIIKSLKKSGKTIFMSTHFLAETQELCDTVAIIDKGKLLQTDTMRNISRSRYGGKMKVEFLEPPSEDQLASIRAIEGVVKIERQNSSPSEVVIEHDGGQEKRAELVERLIRLGLKILTYRPAENMMESFYLNLMTESGD